MHKKREPKGFGWGHFPKGTVVEYHVTDGSQSQPKMATVGKLHCTEPGCYVIEADAPDPETGSPAMFNIVWVTKIIKRGPGEVVFAVSEVGVSDALVTHKNKSKRDYAFIGARVFLRWYLETRYLDHVNANMVDVDKLAKLLSDQGVFRNAPWLRTVVLANKKKLHQLVPRLIPKARIALRAVIREHNQNMDEFYHEDLRESFNMYFSNVG
jgi:hypothetical protein